MESPVSAGTRRAPGSSARRSRLGDPTRRIRRSPLFPRRARGIRVLLVRGDPYLALLLRMQLPGCEVLEAEDEDRARELIGSKPALVVAPVRPENAFLDELLRQPDRPPVVGLVDTDGARTPPPDAIDQILLRPFVPGELHQAVRRALGLPEPRPPRPLLPLVRRLIAAGRVGAVALAGILMVRGQFPTWRAVALAFAFVYATARLPVWRWPRTAMIGDAVIVAGLVAMTGGQNSVFLAFALVTLTGVGVEGGPRAALFAGGLVSVGSFAVVAQALINDRTRAVDAVAFLMLFPLAGLAAGYATRTLAGVDPEGAVRFAEANRMLSALYRMTRTMPGGLEVSTVARTAVQELAETLGAHAGVVLVEEGGVLSPASAFGVESVEELNVHPNEGSLGAAIERGQVAVLDAGSMAPAHAMVLKAYPRWFVAPIRRGGAVLGVLLAAEPSHAEGSARVVLQRLSAEAGVALENARLFARVRGLTIDDERRRVAREIHDGVAQALTHVRLELDHLLRYVAQEEKVKVELDRLSRVVKRAGEDVRTTIIGLRSGIAIGKRLVPALESYLADLRRVGGPRIDFEAEADPLLAEEPAGECFRIAQEAVSNALRHAGCAAILVRVSADDENVVLVVHDDGIGLPEEFGPGAGVGILGMKERALRIGATLDVSSPRGGGTIVRLTVTKGAEP